METNGLNKMVLIKSFLTRAFHGYGKFIYVYLSEGDKAREYYSCLKLMMQAHSHVGLFKVFLIKHVPIK